LRIKRRGVSPIIAELLLIVITVAIGTLVYSFASSAFGGFGAGFSNLVQEAGNQLAENVVVEQVYFVNAANVTCPNQCGDLYIRNTGSNTAMIDTIYMTNVTASSAITPDPNPTIDCPLTPLKGDVCFNIYNGAPDYNGQISQSTPISLAPGIAVMVRFNLPIGSSVYDKANHISCIPGTVYAFVLVTGRGNQFVAYQKR
jgi:flagellin-like protein